MFFAAHFGYPGRLPAGVVFEGVDGSALDMADVFRTEAAGFFLNIGTILQDLPILQRFVKKMTFIGVQRVNFVFLGQAAQLNDKASFKTQVNVGGDVVPKSAAPDLRDEEKVIIFRLFPAEVFFEISTAGFGGRNAPVFQNRTDPGGPPAVDDGKVAPGVDFADGFIGQRFVFVKSEFLFQRINEISEVHGEFFLVCTPDGGYGGRKVLVNFARVGADKLGLKTVFRQDVFGDLDGKTGFVGDGRAENGDEFPIKICF